MEFRLLEADDIECRISTCSQYGVSLLLYKNARVDMNLLDSTAGEFNWQREHKELKGNIYCGVGTVVRSPIQIRKKGRRPIASRGHVSTGGSEENFILHHRCTCFLKI